MNWIPTFETEFDYDTDRSDSSDEEGMNYGAEYNNGDPPDPPPPPDPEIELPDKEDNEDCPSNANPVVLQPAEYIHHSDYKGGRVGQSILYLHTKNKLNDKFKLKLKGETFFPNNLESRTLPINRQYTPYNYDLQGGSGGIYARLLESPLGETNLNWSDRNNGAAIILGYANESWQTRLGINNNLSNGKTIVLTPVDTPIKELWVLCRGPITPGATLLVGPSTTGDSALLNIPAVTGIFAYEQGTQTVNGQPEPYANTKITPFNDVIDRGVDLATTVPRPTTTKCHWYMTWAIFSTPISTMYEKIYIQGAGTVYFVGGTDESGTLMGMLNALNTNDAIDLMEEDDIVVLPMRGGLPEQTAETIRIQTVDTCNVTTINKLTAWAPGTYTIANYLQETLLYNGPIASLTDLSTNVWMAGIQAPGGLFGNSQARNLGYSTTWKHLWDATTTTDISALGASGIANPVYFYFHGQYKWKNIVIYYRRSYASSYVQFRNWTNNAYTTVANYSFPTEQVIAPCIKMMIIDTSMLSPFQFIYFNLLDIVQIRGDKDIPAAFNLPAIFYHSSPNQIPTDLPSGLLKTAFLTQQGELTYPHHSDVSIFPYGLASYGYLPWMPKKDYRIGQYQYIVKQNFRNPAEVWQYWEYDEPSNPEDNPNTYTGPNWDNGGAVNDGWEKCYDSSFPYILGNQRIYDDKNRNQWWRRKNPAWIN